MEPYSPGRPKGDPAQPFRRHRLTLDVITGLVPVIHAFLWRGK